MSEESKDATIKKIYKHPITGYGSTNDTLKQASKINPSIKVADVRDYLNKLKHRQTQFQHKKNITPSYLLTLYLKSRLT